MRDASSPCTRGYTSRVCMHARGYLALTVVPAVALQRRFGKSILGGEGGSIRRNRLADIGRTSSQNIARLAPAAVYRECFGRSRSNVWAPQARLRNRLFLKSIHEHDSARAGVSAAGCSRSTRLFSSSKRPGWTLCPPRSSRGCTSCRSVRLSARPSPSLPLPPHALAARPKCLRGLVTSQRAVAGTV